MAAAGGSSAPSGHHHYTAPPQPIEWDPRDPSRRWDALSDGRMRFSLHRHLKGDENDLSIMSGRNGSGRKAASAFANALPEDLAPGAAAAELEAAAAAIESPTMGGGNTVVNVCADHEPRVELELKGSVINAITNAYTSSGYPSVMTAGNARGAVYGSFVDLKGPSVHTLNLPPRETIMVAPSTTTSGSANNRSSSSSKKKSTGSGNTAAAANGDSSKMETLMKVVWRRSERLVVPTTDRRPDGASSSSNASLRINPATAAAMNLQRPTTLQQHIQQFPEGIHGRQSSPNLRALILRGAYPTTREEALAFPVVGPVTGPAAAASNNPLQPASQPTPPQGPSQSPSSPTSNAESNVPPPGLLPTGGTPVQHTLVAANTFNHLSVHVVAHQDGRFLYCSPVQTLSVSIASRKVTAHQLLMMGREEVDLVDDGEGYDAMAASGSVGSSSLPTPASPLGASGRSGRTGSSPVGLSSTGSSGGTAPVGDPSTDCVNGRREKLSFQQLSVPDEMRPVLFDPSSHVEFHGADPKRRTINAALVGFQVEPLLLFGNQNGDIFLHSILEERVIQRLNFNAGLSVINSTTVIGGGGGGGGKFICSPVSVIVEVQNGLEKKLGALAQNAVLAKRNGQGSFVVEESVKYPHMAVNPGNRTDAYYPLEPSMFAIGFDSSDVLLMCVSCQGAWMLKRFGCGHFGLRPIQAIAPRQSSFFVRLWASYATAPTAAAATPAGSRRPSASTSPPASLSSSATSGAVKKHRSHSHSHSQGGSGGSGSAPPAASTLLSSITTLFVPDEVQHVAAISCGGGCIVLARLPGLEILSTVAMYDFNAVGEVLALAWTATCPSMLLTPDILFATGEDDTVSAFQLVSVDVIPRPRGGAVGFTDTTASEGGSGALHQHPHHHAQHQHQPLTGGLRILERKRFHRSWINNLAVLPLVLPVSRAGPGMPQYLGTALLACSYDNSTSFWPVLFANSNRGGANSPRQQPNNSNLSGSLEQQQQQEEEQYLLVEGPTAACPLHNELVVATAVGGGGTSHFVASVCCRGRLRLWSTAVKSD